MPKSRRETLPIHPAAELFPLMSPDELRELGEDIKKNGLTSPVAITTDGQLLDGRNRLDAMEMASIKFKFARGANRSIRIEVGADRLYWPEIVDSDPYAYVISANIRRRHLNVEQRQHLLITLIARAPEKSDRQIGGEIGVDHKTIASARAKGETTGEISPVEKRVGKDGKSRKSPSHRPPAHKPRKAKRAKVTDPPPQMGRPEPPRDDIGANSTAEAARLRVRVEELEADKRRLEIKIRGLESEIEELRGKLKAGGDMSIGEFHLAIKKWEETVETQRGIIARLENENAKLRAGVGALPADDMPPIPAFLLRRAAP